MLFRKMTIAGYAWLHNLDIQRDSENSKIFLKHKKRKGKKAEVNRSVSLGHRNGPSSPKQGINRSRTDPIMHGDSHSEGGSISRGVQRSGSLHRSGTWRSTAVPSKPQELLTTMELLHYVQTHPHT